MVVYSPFSDYVASNSMLVPRGSHAWLPARLLLSRGSPTTVPPDSDAYERIDFGRIFDPDGVEKFWGTSALDPTDPSDTLQASSAEYVGLLSRRTVTDGVTTSGSAIVTSATAAFNSNDIGKPITGTGIPVSTTVLSVQSTTQATLSANATASGTGISFLIGRENTGLFSQGYPSAQTGRFALKVLVPSDAEDTSASPTRNYTIRWSILKNDTIVVHEETFNIGPSGAIAFGGDVVSVEEVRAGFYTSLGNDEVIAASEEAIEAVKAWIEDNCGVDPDTLTEMPRGLKQAILWWTRDLLGLYDAGAGSLAEMLQEGGERISFGGRGGQALLKTPMERALMFLTGWCKVNSTRRARPMIGTINVDPYQAQGILDHGWGDIVIPSYLSTNTVVDTWVDD